MRQFLTSGSVRGAPGDRRSYRDLRHIVLIFLTLNWSAHKICACLTFTI